MKLGRGAAQGRIAVTWFRLLSRRDVVAITCDLVRLVDAGTWRVEMSELN